jgi:hypothetical protein
VNMSSTLASMNWLAYNVLFEGMLGRVTAHELSHVVRGHATADGQATHGWFREGDAQRDAWHALTELLTDPAWATVALWGLAAQVRLADRQPDAYRWFDIDWTERSHFAHAINPASWLVGPSRDVFVLAKGGPIEVPISVLLRRTWGSPCVGDHVYLSDHDMTAGPWVVTATRKRSRISHPKDRAAIDVRAKESRSNLEIEWLSLRHTIGMHATESEIRKSQRLSARGLTPEEVEELTGELLLPFAEVVAIVADRRVAERADDSPYDPFDDWR